MKSIKVGTRGSRLALIQTQLFIQHAQATYPNLTFEIVPIKTKGDKIQDRPLREIGGKSLFIKDIELQLQQGFIDVAVHSMKDMEHPFTEGIMIACVLEREDPRDAFISFTASDLLSLPHGAVVGTCSPRRMAWALYHRPDLNIVTFRGNVETRLKKLQSGEVQGTFLAMAGLKRLGIADCATRIYSVEELIPAASQGIIAIQCRQNDYELAAYLATLNHHPTAYCMEAEQSFLKEMQGDCNTPLGAYAHLEGQTLHIRAFTATLEGFQFRTEYEFSRIIEPEALGRRIATRLLYAKAS